jgi:2-octaprenylphenol hydroxylase
MIVIIGAGMVGLVLATALAKARFPIALIETHPPIEHNDSHQFDARVSAINVASQQILQNLGVWQSLPKEAYAPLRALRVWDHLGGGEIDFDSAEIGEAQLGFIVDNRALIKMMWENLRNFPSVSIFSPCKPLAIVQSPAQLQVILENHDPLLAQLIIGADGSHSWVREQMAVTIHERSYEQQAIIAVVHNVLPHQFTGWQSFLPSGPLGVLPLADEQTTAIVWSNSLLETERLMSLPLSDFNAELTQALNQRLGMMNAITPLKRIPLVMRHAQEYVQARFALIGDAAHTIHPLAGQGVNLGLMDAAVLAQVLMEAKEKNQDIGGLRVLRRYQRWRKGDNTLMLALMRGFKELFGSENRCMVECRSQGLRMSNKIPAFKKLFMNYAMGRQGELPDLAKVN